MAAPDLVFVYGTLMRGFDHPMSRRLAASAEFLGEARCQGRLYMVAHYPGLLRSDDVADIVFGELYRVHDDDELLAVLDGYESIGPGYAAPTLYLRETSTARWRRRGPISTIAASMKRSGSYPADFWSNNFPCPPGPASKTSADPRPIASIPSCPGCCVSRD